MTRAILISLVAVFTSLSAGQQPGSTSRSASTVVAHPLDPLTLEEIRTAVQAAKADSRLAGTAFPSIALLEPPKTDVLSWRPGQSLPRRALVQAMTADRVFEVVVDLNGRRVVSMTERTGGEPSITLSEIEATKLVLENAEFKAGLQKRGITDTTKVFCAPFSAGYYGQPESASKRLVKVGCFDTRRTTTNLFGWPIERLYALFDLRKREVLSVTDYGVVPVADGDLNYTERAIGTLRDARRPTILSQPSGSNFHLDGHEVTWGKWRFHARVDPRVGTVISVVRWQDTGGPRSVLYQGYLSEMFVPYMDAEYGWQTRTYFDTGEYGAGVLATPLRPGIDCPTTATFLPADFGDDKGEPFTTPNALCVFERGTGEPIWRHSEVLNQTYEGRANVELVVRMASTIGNYDYVFDWIFNDAAEIEVRVGATGIVALKGVAARQMSDTTASAETRYGTLVAPNLVAVNHDHYFNFRLDLDVDGLGNSFNREVYRQMRLPADSPRRSLYVVEPAIAATEKAAQFDAHGAPSKLHVMNERRSNRVGNPVSYEVLAANHARLLLDQEDWPARRARFLQHDVWVTPYEPSERYAGGQYIFGSRGDDGLAVWAAKDRPIRNQDIVVWVNLGMHHLTRAEDLPVMPTVWHSFRLRPHNFFDRNPAIDLRNDTSEQ
ncbi:MAG: tyramine oxidase [Vicinamibacterales bacterium]